MLRATLLLLYMVASVRSFGDHADHSAHKMPHKRHKRGFSLMPTVPAGLYRRAQCSPGQYYDNGCKACTAGSHCTGNDGQTQCGAGSYSTAGATACTGCPQGTWTDQSGTQCASDCKAVQGGYKANQSSGATTQVPCGVGYYSPGNTDTCTICPAGHYCNSQTTTTPTPCAPGQYAPTTGCGQSCEPCPAGYFNSVSGATACCKCCSGWYNDQTSQTQCFSCPGVGASSQGSPPGATSKGQCTFSLTDNKATCSQSGSACPAVQNTATTSARARRSGRMLNVCPNTFEKRCPVSRAKAIVGRREDAGGVGNFGIDPEIGPYECLDVRANLESCGGCVPEGEIMGPDGGKDCTAIDHISAVKCVAGKCIIGSCRTGYRVSADKSSCIKMSAHKHRGQGAHAHGSYHDF